MNHNPSPRFTSADRLGVLFAVLATLPFGSLQAATFVVTSGDDDGAVGTLRAAVTSANSTPGDDVIQIDNLTVNLESALPSITENLKIEGNSPDAAAIVGPDGNAAFYRVLSSEPAALLELENLTIRGGQLMAANGAGIQALGGLTANNVVVEECVIEGGNFSYGAGIYAAGAVVLNNCTIRANTIRTASAAVTSYGAGLCFTGASLLLNQSTVSENQVQFLTGRSAGEAAPAADSGRSAPLYSAGGGVAIYGLNAVLMLSTISGNKVSTGGLIGGVLYSPGHGAGVHTTNILTIEHCTITNNAAEAAAGGSGTAGGIYNEGGSTVSLINSIVAGNDGAGEDLGGAFVSHGFNLIGDPAGFSISYAMGADPATDSFNQNAMLGPLADNGGPTRTHALLVGSPAFNQGTDAAISGGAFTLDQRGEARVLFGTADIGAFEAEYDASTIQRWVLF